MFVRLTDEKGERVYVNCMYVGSVHAQPDGGSLVGVQCNIIFVREHPEAVLQALETATAAFRDTTFDAARQVAARSRPR